MIYMLQLKSKKLFKLLFWALNLFVVSTVMFPLNGWAATVQNSGDKAAIIIVAEGATRRDYSIDPQKQISFCLKGCFITLANGDRYALDGSEVLEVSGSRINFH